MKFVGRTFEDEDIILDGHVYENCIFRQVRFSYSAISGIGMSRCKFHECRWAFNGPAASTLAFMSATYNGLGEAGRNIVNKTFDNIRDGRSFGVPSANTDIAYKPTVFLGHGRSADYMFLKDFLQKKGYQVETFESSPRAGMSVKDVIKGMIGRASMAFLVHTAEDEHGDETVRARENVVHETGLFQGRLGYERAIVMREEGCAPFSNLDGIQYIAYPPNNIKASFMEVLETIEREYPSAA
ncbi:TIR domain-containing protein [Arthrobacter sp. A5]|uniref:TIR domain-containing protein n=1 Tax=Arthrobacter sp. A5 TaxID=576926 RepID=UPI003DA8A115